MTALPWPTNISAKTITPSRPYTLFSVNGKTYRAVGVYGLVKKQDQYFIVSIFLSGSTYYYDTGIKGRTQELLGIAAGPVPPNVGGTFMALYPNVYEVRRNPKITFTGPSSTVFSSGNGINIGNQSTTYLASFYSALNKGSDLLRNPEEMRLAMQRIKDAFVRELGVQPGMPGIGSLFSENNSPLQPGMPGITSFKIRLRLLLLRAGFPLPKIESFLAGRSLGVIRTGRGSGDTGGSTPGGSLEQRIVVRAPFGYIKPAEKGTEDRAQIAQIYPVANTTLPISTPSPVNALQQYATERFVFPYIPNNIQYQGSGSEWVEIPRGSDFPIVEWSRWQLLKISMEFLIANQRVEDVATGTKVPDGFFTSVYDQIETLRRMAQRPYPVSVFGLDQFFAISMRRAQLTGKPLEFVITDFSWTATRRTIGTNPSDIAVASCRMTLQEIPIEETTVVKFKIPILAPNKTPKKKGQQPELPYPETDFIDKIDTSTGPLMSTNAASYTATSTAKRTTIAQLGANGAPSNGSV